MNKASRRIVAVFVMAAMLLTSMSVGADVAFAKGGKKGISVAPKSLTLQVGEKKKVKVKYSKIRKKAVKWKTSNKKIATVSKGTIRAKKAGTVTITAKVGKYKAKIKVKVRKKPADAYTYLNDFRTKRGVWYWKAGNKAKRYFNTNRSNTLAPLKRDIELENTARLRAQEITIVFDHKRPNGEDCFTAYPSGLTAAAENIAYGYTTAWKVTNAWIEENMKYEGQGHRRNMLDKRFTHVGIASFEYNGRTYWVQCFGRR